MAGLSNHILPILNNFYDKHQGYTNGGYTVVASPEQYELARRAGRGRKQENIKQGNATKATTIEQEVESCLAEIMVNHMFGRELSYDDLVIPGEEYSKKKHNVHDAVLRNLPIEIKTVNNPHYNLVINCNTYRNEARRYGEALPVLMTLVQGREVTIKGWLPLRLVSYFSGERIGQYTPTPRRDEVFHSKSRNPNQNFYKTDKYKILSFRTLGKYLDLCKESGILETV